MTERIPASEILNIVLASGKKPRHAQNLVLSNVFDNQVAVTSTGFIESKAITVDEMLAKFFTKYQVDVDKLIDHPDLSFETKQRLYRILSTQTQ